MQFMKIEPLKWDTDFFQKKIGKIDFTPSEANEFQSMLLLAMDQEYQLLYVFGDENLNIDDSILKKFNGRLVDRKCLYTISITDSDKTEMVVEEYNSNITNDEIKSLALLSGGHSRFHLDKRFNENVFTRLYTTWIERSVNREIADKVFVVKEFGKIMGMITLACTESTGRIGLFAVSDKAHGKGYGKRLINACVNELISRKIFLLEVPTQMSNTTACHFYEKCGFQIKSITNIYHFWL